jgi:hypothetical protein
LQAIGRGPDRCEACCHAALVGRTEVAVLALHPGDACFERNAACVPSRDVEGRFLPVDLE